MRFISSSVPFFRLRSVRRQGRWNAFELNTQRRDETRRPRKKKFQKRYPSSILLTRRSRVCVLDARVRVKARLIYDSKGCFVSRFFFTKRKKYTKIDESYR